MALAQFPIIEKRHGYQPFRLSKGVSIIFVGAHLIPKRAPFEKDLGKAMQEIVEAGLVTFYKRRYISPKYLTGSEEISKQASPTAFTLLHIMGALVILLGGLTVATLAFLVEVSSSGKGKGTLRAGKRRFCLRFIERAVE